MGFKFENDLISIYKAVETYRARVKKYYDDEDELMDYINRLITAIRMKFNFHKNTLVDIQLIATSNSKVSVYNLSLQKEKYFTKSDLELIAEYDENDLDEGRLYDINLFFAPPYSGGYRKQVYCRADLEKKKSVYLINNSKEKMHDRMSAAQAVLVGYHSLLKNLVMGKYMNKKDIQDPIEQAYEVCYQLGHAVDEEWTFDE